MIGTFDALYCRISGGVMRVGRVDVRALVKKDFDDRGAADGLALDVLDAVDGRGDRALVVAGDPLLHVLGAEAVVLPDDRDDRNVDLGENVGRHVEDREDSSQHDEHRHDDEGVRAREGEPNDPHRYNLGSPPASVLLLCALPSDYLSINLFTSGRSRGARHGALRRAHA
jgi:hypothetical protein